MAAMNDTDFEIVRAAEARRALTNGDLKADVAFQNDVNLLLSSLDLLWDLAESQPPNR